MVFNFQMLMRRQQFEDDSQKQQFIGDFDTFSYQMIPRFFFSNTMNLALSALGAEIHGIRNREY